MIQIIGIFLFFVLLFALLYKKYSTLHVLETPEIYKTKILPYLEKMYLENTKWMRDIIQHKSDQIVYYRNSKFVICKDQKWKTDNLKDFYILCIPTEKIMTIRNLRQKHIPLIENMRLEMIRIAKFFKINSNDLVFFFHYMPSIFQLHLHCCLKDNYHATNLSIGVYYFDTVINGLKRDNNYWNKATMSYTLPYNHPMCIELYLK
jgi:m7GpppX diphosphatase